MYFLVDHHKFREHKLKLPCQVGIAAFTLTFPICLDPVASAPQATVPQR
jgi:hypothetical protein